MYSHKWVVACAFVLACAGENSSGDELHEAKQEEQEQEAEPEKLGSDRLFTALPADTAEDPEVSSYQIGNFKFTLPKDHHLNHYATDETYNGLIDLYRLAPGQDPRYLARFPDPQANGCSKFSMEMIRMKSGPGRIWKYCRAVIENTTYQSLMGGRQLAQKHLEVAVDPSATQPYRRVVVQVFDEVTPFQRNRSWFHEICRNSPDQWKSEFSNQNLLQGYWDDEKAVGDIWICTVNLGGLGEGAGLWKVGGFVFAAGEQQSINWAAPENFFDRKAVEVVYMEKFGEDNALNWQFARKLQRFSLSAIEKTTPF